MYLCIYYNNSRIVGWRLALIGILFSASLYAMYDEQKETTAHTLLRAVAQEQPSVIEKLLHTVDVNATTEDGRTALHEAARTGRVVPALLLLASRAQVDARDGKGYTPLMVAASWGHTLVLEQLLLYGAQVDARSDDDTTALLYATGHQHLPAVERLIEAKANVHEAMNDGLTPMTSAAFIGNQDVIKLLIEAKADPCAEDEAGRTAAAVAFHFNNIRALIQLKRSEYGKRE